MKKLWPLLIVLAVSGCQTVNTTQRAEPRSEPKGVEQRRVITDTSLGAAASFQDVKETTTGDNLLKIQVALRNETNNEQRVLYRFEWFDDEGMLIDTKLSTWRQTTLFGKETVRLTGVAPRPDAVDFQLKVKEP